MFYPPLCSKRSNHGGILKCSTLLEKTQIYKNLISSVSQISDRSITRNERNGSPLIVFQICDSLDPPPKPHTTHRQEPPQTTSRRVRMLRPMRTRKRILRTSRLDWVGHTFDMIAHTQRSDLSSKLHYQTQNSTVKILFWRFYMSKIKPAKKLAQICRLLNRFRIHYSYLNNISLFLD